MFVFVAQKKLFHGVGSDFAREIERAADQYSAVCSLCERVSRVERVLAAVKGLNRLGVILKLPREVNGRECPRVVDRNGEHALEHAVEQSDRAVNILVGEHTHHTDDRRVGQEAVDRRLQRLDSVRVVSAVEQNNRTFGEQLQPRGIYGVADRCF